MSRLRPPFVLFAAALLAAGIALSACGGGGGDKSGESASAVLDEATLEGIDSGKLDLSFVLASQSDDSGLELSISGPFQSEGKGSLPRLDMEASVKASGEDEKIDFDGGLALLPNSAYVNYEGTEYEVDPTTFAFVESALKEALGEPGSTADVAACEEVFAELEIANIVEDPVSEGSAKVGGVETTKVSGDLDVFAAPDAVLEALESPACRAQLSAAGPLPSKSEIEESEEKVRDVLKGAQLDVYVGDDNIIRQLSMHFVVEGDGSDEATGDLDLKLTGVNEDQAIAAPGDAKPLSKLFLKLGVNPIELLGLLEGEGEGLNELLEGLGASQLR